MQAAIAATFSRHIPIRRGIREGLFLFSLSSFRQSQTISIKAAPFYIKASPFYIKGIRFYNNPFASPPAAKVPEHTPLARKTRKKNNFFNRSRENEKKEAEPTHLLSAPRCRKKEAGFAFTSEMDYSFFVTFMKIQTCNPASCP
ncbi:MAG: hypothetical protein IK000_10045 [Bacteroidaceae bacterium]|nr:hypothetical protein [Bacteroidaceae bacterium]